MERGLRLLATGGHTRAKRYDATPYNAAIMTRKGVVVSLNSDSDELQRHLNLEAAKVMRYGGLERNGGAGDGDDQSGEATWD